MDIFSHAIAGAAVGHYYGSPIIGVIIAISPDLVLIGKRRKLPTVFYDFCHSFLALIVSGPLFGFIFNIEYILAYLAYFSHLYLDLFTHGKIWGSPLLWPFSNKRFPYGQEWEFNTRIWYIGLIFTIIWSYLWLLAK